MDGWFRTPSKEVEVSGHKLTFRRPLSTVTVPWESRGRRIIAEMSAAEKAGEPFEPCLEDLETIADEFAALICRVDGTAIALERDDVLREMRAVEMIGAWFKLASALRMDDDEKKASAPQSRARSIPNGGTTAEPAPTLPRSPETVPSPSTTPEPSPTGEQ